MFWFLIHLMVGVVFATFIAGFSIFILNLPATVLINSSNKTSIVAIGKLWRGINSCLIFSLWSGFCAFEARQHGANALWLYGIIGFLYVFVFLVRAIVSAARIEDVFDTLQSFIEMIFWLAIPMFSYILFLFKPQILSSIIRWFPFH